MCFEALTWPVLYDRVYRDHSLACHSRPAASLVVEEVVFGVTPHSPGLTALLATLEIGMSAGSASYSLLLASCWPTNSRISHASEFGWACPPGSHVRQHCRDSSHDRHPSPIVVILGGAMHPLARFWGTSSLSRGILNLLK